MNEDDWLYAVASAVRRRLPDADVDDVNEGCLAICKGRAAVAVSVTQGMALALASLDRGCDGPWSVDRVAHEQPLIFRLSESSVAEANDSIVALLI